MNSNDIIGDDNIGGETRKMTINDKLDIIVSGIIDKGYTFNLVEPSLLQINEKHIIFIEYSYEKLWHKEPSKGRAYITLTIADLLADPDAMKSAYGKDDTCPYCGYLRESLDGCDLCYQALQGWHEYISIWQYRALEALKLIHNKGADAAIEYLFQNLPKC